MDQETINEYVWTALDFCGSATENAKMAYTDNGLSWEDDPNFETKVYNAIAAYSASV